MLGELPSRFQFLEPPIVFSRNVQIDLREATLEGQVFQKLHDWEARKRMLPREILEASNATRGETEFLLGLRETDPDPEHVLVFTELVDSGEVIEIPDNIDINAPILPKIRVPKKSLSGLSFSQKMRQAFLDADTLSGNRSRTFHKQTGLIAFLEETFPDAICASDGAWSEFRGLEKVTYRINETEFTSKDPHLDHLIKYRRLVASSDPKAFKLICNP